MSEQTEAQPQRLETEPWPHNTSRMVADPGVDTRWTYSVFEEGTMNERGTLYVNKHTDGTWSASLSLDRKPSVGGKRFTDRAVLQEAINGFLGGKR